MNARQMRRLLDMERDVAQGIAQNYARYITSDAWHYRRLEAIRRAGYKCQVCGARNVQLEAHHNSYARFGSEPPEDVVVLCQWCHARHHGKVWARFVRLVVQWLERKARRK